MRGPHHHRSGTADDDNFAELDPLVAVGDAIACTGAAAAAAAAAGGAASPADAALALSRVHVLERNRGLLGRMLDLEEANITDKVQSPGASLAQPLRSFVRPASARFGLCGRMVLSISPERDGRMVR